MPILAEIPLLGDLFRYDAVTEQRSELLIILTPRVIRTEQDAEMIKQVESSRMSWVLCDVVSLHGPAGLRSRCDEWTESDSESVYPTHIPMEGELTPTPASTQFNGEYTPAPAPTQIESEYAPTEYAPTPAVDGPLMQNNVESSSDTVEVNGPDGSPIQTQVRYRDAEPASYQRPAASVTRLPPPNSN